jgi:tRNA U34 5-carboxymethylaminomethyl modifying GTPase MnmE/TrmE
VILSWAFQFFCFDYKDPAFLKASRNLHTVDALQQIVDAIKEEEGREAIDSLQGAMEYQEEHQESLMMEEELNDPLMMHPQ